MDDCLALSSVCKITHAYTYLTELCQQVFIDNEAAQCTSHTSYGQLLELSRYHQVILVIIKQRLHICYIHLVSARSEHFVWCGCIYIYR